MILHHLTEIQLGMLIGATLTLAIIVVVLILALGVVRVSMQVRHLEELRLARTNRTRMRGVP